MNPLPITKHNWILMVASTAVIIFICPTICLTIIVVSTTVILSCIIAFVIYAKRHWNSTDNEYSTVFNDYQFRPYLSELVQKSQKTTKPLSSSSLSNFTITGSPKLDKVIDEIFDCLIQDFIDSWYRKLTNDRRFPNSLKRIASRTLKALCDRLRKIDFVVLLTRYFVDDIASHVRLYRLSKEKRTKQEILFKEHGRRHPDDLESIFFDMELEMEQGRICRDLIVSSPAYERACLHDITDLLLYLLLPSEDFRCRPFRFLVREILIGKVLMPIVNTLSDPDYLNYLVVWMLSNHATLLSEDFLTIIHTCGSIQDLEAILEALKDEITILHSKGSQSTNTQNEIQMLENAVKMIKKRMQRLASKEKVPSSSSAFYVDNNLPSDIIKLPIELILTNSIALSNFSTFLATADKQSYLDLYLAIEGFTNSVSNQMRMRAGKNAREDSDYQETIKEAATFIYHQFLATNAVTKLPIDEDLVNKFLVRMRSDAPVDSWFDDIHKKIIELLANNPNLYRAFIKDPLYRRTLEELEIIDENSDLSSISNYEHSVNKTHKYAKLIIEVGMLGVGSQQDQNLFAVYNVRVQCVDAEGETKRSWNVIRRYTDFYKLNVTVQQKFPKLQNIDFPGKKTFNNLKQQFLERRCKALNLYMSTVTDPIVLKANPGLENEINEFLSQQKYIGTSSTFPKKIVTAVFDPIFTGVKTIGNAWNVNFLKTIKTATNTSKPPALDFSRVASSLDLEVDDASLPLRVLILLVDEIFGLQSRNQWFRARIISALRQFLHITYGHSLNRKIISVVRNLTSETQMTGYLCSLRDNLRSKKFYAKAGQKHPTHGPRNKILARYLMLSAIPTQLRFAFGTRATNDAVNNVSDVIQHATLNRRLCYVLLERIFISIFPKNNVKELLSVLNSRSPRVQR